MQGRGSRTQVRSPTCPPPSTDQAFADYFSLWFLGAPFDSIKRQNVRELLAYGFHYSSVAVMEAAGQGRVLDDMVSELEACTGVRLSPGYDASLGAMFHLRQPLKVTYRPFLFYVGTEALGAMCFAIFTLGYGLRMHYSAAEGTIYFTSRLGTPAAGPTPQPSLPTSNPPPHTPASPPPPPPPAAAAAAAAAQASSPQPEPSASAASVTGAALECLLEPLLGAAASMPDPPVATHDTACAAPIVFLHGVGCGFLLYIDFVRRLAALDAPLLACEHRHISMKLCSSIPTADDVAHSVMRILDAHGVGKACFVGHSYGTFVASRVAQCHSARVQSMVLIDPVCFRLFMPHLLFNFIYRAPRTGVSLLLRVKDWFARLVARDMHVAATFCRRFYWSDVNLWPDQILDKTLVVLHGKDELIEVEKVHALVLRHASKLLLHKDYGHADFLFHPAWCDVLVSNIAQMARAGEDIHTQLLHTSDLTLPPNISDTTRTSSGTVDRPPSAGGTTTTTTTLSSAGGKGVGVGGGGDSGSGGSRGPVTVTLTQRRLSINQAYEEAPWTHEGLAVAVGGGLLWQGCREAPQTAVTGAGQSRMDAIDELPVTAHGPGAAGGSSTSKTEDSNRPLRGRSRVTRCTMAVSRQGRARVQRCPPSPRPPAAPHPAPVTPQPSAGNATAAAEVSLPQGVAAATATAHSTRLVASDACCPAHSTRQVASDACCPAHSTRLAGVVPPVVGHAASCPPGELEAGVVEVREVSGGWGRCVVETVLVRAPHGGGGGGGGGPTQPATSAAHDAGPPRGDLSAAVASPDAVASRRAAGADPVSDAGAAAAAALCPGTGAPQAVTAPHGDDDSKDTPVTSSQGAVVVGGGAGISVVEGGGGVRGWEGECRQGAAAAAAAAAGYASQGQVAVGKPVLVHQRAGVHQREGMVGSDSSGYIVVTGTGGPDGSGSGSGSGSVSGSGSSGDGSPVRGPRQE
ncbi:MAG: hypothetical protein WDW36_000516 [Sanguina aurantia]